MWRKRERERDKVPNERAQRVKPLPPRLETELDPQDPHGARREPTSET